MLSKCWYISIKLHGITPQKKIPLKPANLTLLLLTLAPFGNSTLTMSRGRTQVAVRLIHTQRTGLRLYVDLLWSHIYPEVISEGRSPVLYVSTEIRDLF
jgi:uncharacterized membrane protein YobD (UPF0266 family)